MHQFSSRMDEGIQKFLPNSNSLPKGILGKTLAVVFSVLGFGSMFLPNTLAQDGLNIQTSLQNNILSVKKLIVTNGTTTKVQLDENGILVPTMGSYGVVKVGTNKYLTGGLVQSQDISSNSITENHIQNYSITGIHIQNYAITTNHIASGTITCDDLDSRLGNIICNGIKANLQCPTGQYLVGITTGAGPICAPTSIPNLPSCENGEVLTRDAAENRRTCTKFSPDATSLWAHPSSMGVEDKSTIYNKNLTGNVGIGLSSPFEITERLTVKGSLSVKGLGSPVSLPGGPSITCNSPSDTLVKNICYSCPSGYNFDGVSCKKTCISGEVCGGGSICKVLVGETSGTCIAPSTSYIANGASTYGSCTDSSGCNSGDTCVGATSNTTPGTTTLKMTVGEWRDNVYVPSAATVYYKNQTFSTSQTCFVSGPTGCIYDKVDFSICISGNTQPCSPQQIAPGSHTVSVPNGSVINVSSVTQSYTKGYTCSCRPGDICDCVDLYEDIVSRTITFALQSTSGTTTSSPGVCVVGSTTAPVALATPDPTAILYVTGGRVGILTSNPQHHLDVVGNIRAAAYLEKSDARLKTNIQKIDNALEKIMGINGYSYDLLIDGSHHYGVIAQEVERLFPYLVTTDESGLKSVNYNGLVAPIIESLKEINTKVVDLEKQLNSNTSRIEALEKMAK